MVEFNHSTLLMIVLSKVEGQFMLHRIFIAINLSEATKKELTAWQERWSELPARWTKPENLHITLVFYGSASDQELEKIKMMAKEVAQKHRAFSLKLSKIVYGPNEKMARMVWALGESSEEFLALQHKLATTLDREEDRAFSLHLTLARLKEWEFLRIDPEERPRINEEISIKISVNSIEIMESKLKRSGAEYTICESISLA